MKPEIYEQDGVKRCRIKVSETETVDRIATDDDLLAAADAKAYEEASEPAPEPTPAEPYKDG